MRKINRERGYSGEKIQTRVALRISFDFMTTLMLFSLNLNLQLTIQSYITLQRPFKVLTFANFFLLMQTPKIHRGRERLTSSLYGVHPVKKPTQNNPIPTKPIENQPTPSKGVTDIKFIYENIHQEYSLLGFLTGGKNFPDEELVFNKPTSTLKGIHFT